MRQNLSGIIILFGLWIPSAIACLRLSPETGLFGAVGAGLVLALLLCTPVAVIAGLLAKPFIRL